MARHQTNVNIGHCLYFSAHEDKDEDKATSRAVALANADSLNLFAVFGPESDVVTARSIMYNNGKGFIEQRRPPIMGSVVHVTTTNDYINLTSYITLYYFVYVIHKYSYFKIFLIFNTSFHHLTTLKL